ncbi:MAG: DUF3313 domain-containing protein [Pseudomonadales bacterium]|nr:DUF3313 domain-containing protein [Pseudomonadales bacterium]
MRHTLYLLLSTALLSGCMSDPVVQSGSTAEVSFDGLHRVDNSRMKDAWVKPDLNLSGYDKIRLLGAGVEYRAVRPASRSVRANANRSDFPMDENQKARLLKNVREVFMTELGKSEHFTIVNDEGPGVLELKGALLDVVSNIPPEAIGRNEFYLSKLGEATLVLELRDSQSEEILARTIDRQAIEPLRMQESNRVLNISELRREIRSWGVLLAKRLDELHENAIAQ